jgi:hypothetical protein
MSFLASALSLAAMVCLALSTPAHFRGIFLRVPEPRMMIALRVAGGALLVLSMLPCIAVWGASVGVVAWFGVSAAAVLMVVPLFAYGPRLRAKIGTRD